MFPTALYLILLPFSTAIKFALPPAKIPAEKCIWNAAHPHALVIVTANVGPGPSQRIDIDTIDSTPQRNVYLSRISTPKHASLSPRTPRARLGCALKTIWPQVCPPSSW